MTRRAWGSAALVALAWPALASAEPGMDALQRYIHDNHKECCPHDNCFPVKPEFVPGGRNGVWRVPGRGEITVEQVTPWRFQAVYACWYRKSPRKVRCLFMPGGDG